MKSSKGIEFIKPDNGYDIWDEKRRAKNGQSNHKKKLIKQYNRKLRKFFKKILEKEKNNEQ